MNDLYHMLEKFRDNACLHWLLLPYTHSYLLATGRYLASRVKYDGSKQFLHRHLYVSPPKNAAILCSVTSLWIKSTTKYNGEGVSNFVIGCENEYL